MIDFTYQLRVMMLYRRFFSKSKDVCHILSSKGDSRLKKVWSVAYNNLCIWVSGARSLRTIKMATAKNSVKLLVKKVAARSFKILLENTPRVFVGEFCF